MFYPNTIEWWFVIVANVLGYFILRFGVISRGAKREIIQFFGGTVLVVSFILMFVFFGIKAGLVLIPIFGLVITPTVELIIGRVNKKLFGDRRPVEHLDKSKKKNVIEGVGPMNLVLTDFFFGEKAVKINALTSKDSDDREFKVCYEINKEELPDFLLEAENREATLKANDILNAGEYAKISLWDRLIIGKQGDVVSLRVQPLIIQNIYLDLKIDIVVNPSDPNQQVANSTILNYYKK